MHFSTNPVEVNNWAVRISLSVGVAEYAAHIASSEDLVAHANLGMQSDVDELPSVLSYL